jgi:glycine hydroxymethyltransferase
MIQNDPEITAIIAAEKNRQEDNIELIASENYASCDVMDACGSVLTNKYAEGYPLKRYYGGCEHVDEIEKIAIARVKKLFNVQYANVQPHSGSAANMAVYLGLLQPGDTILGMSLDHGGHLTHGAKVSFSGRIFNAVSYGIDIATGDIDYNSLRKVAHEHKPKLIIAGFSAFSGTLNWKLFREIADEVGALLLADIAHIAGLIAAGAYPSPVPYADVITSTTHKTLRGPRGGLILAATNKYAKELDFAIFPMTQGGPAMNIIAAKAIAFKEALSADFVRYQQQVIKNAKLFVHELQSYGYNIVTGNTDNHMFLVDLTALGASGKDIEKALEQANITLNKNSIPNDPQGPFITSGIRIGTPAITTRGFKEDEIKVIAKLMHRVMNDYTNSKVIDSVREEVISLCSKFPVYTK